MPPLETYGSYQLVEKLAMGGMAQLYLAKRRAAKGSDERTVVLKRILPHLAEDTTFVAMFLDEARIAARLHHPNVIEILDLGAEGDSYFIAMEYIHGEDLRRITKRGVELHRRMPPPLVCRVVAEACRGLDYAHKRTDAAGKPLQIVHRDVSPQNILVGFDGSVKVVDFGIAKAVDKATVTATGVIKGKHAYMSPEQALGRPIDHRTDVFALGIVLYESLTSTRLFRRATDLQTLKAVSECKVEPASRVFPAVPAELDAILLKALSRDMNARYQTASALAQALEAWLGDRPDGTLEALGLHVSGLFHERLEREAQQGKFMPTQSSVDVGSVSRRPNLATASLRSAALPSTVTDKHKVSVSPLENPNTDLTPVYVAPAQGNGPDASAVPTLSSPPQSPPPQQPSSPQLGSTRVASPVLTPLPPLPGGEPGGTTPFGQALRAGGTSVYGVPDAKTITELSERATNALAAYAVPQPAQPLDRTQPPTPGELPAPRMWPWYVAAAFTTLTIAAVVATVLLDRRDLIRATMTGAVSATAPPASAAAPPPPDVPAPAAPPPRTADTPVEKKGAKPMVAPFGSVPVTGPAYPLARDGDRLIGLLPTAGVLETGDTVRIVGPARGGTKERDFYGVAAVGTLEGRRAELLFDNPADLPDGLFVTGEEGERPHAAAPVPKDTGHGSTLVGSLQLKQSDPSADVAVKNATDFDWTACEVRLPDGRSLKLGATVVIHAGGTQWITGAGFRQRANAVADAKLADGFGFVKCAEGDGYLKAALLP